MEQEEPSNFEQKCLCVLVLDTSYSMEGTPIQELNAGLQSFQRELLKDEITRDRLEVAIVTFDSEVNVIQSPALLTEFTMPVLKENGSTRMIDGLQEAISLVENRKLYYKAHGITYYRPWIVMMTDGYPDDGQDVDGMSKTIADSTNAKKFIFMPIGVGNDFSESVLKKLATPSFPPMQLQAVKFCEFFTWLSNSFSTLSTSQDGTVTLENPTRWLDRMLEDN
jgi:uncharacterized protein YegL